MNINKITLIFFMIIITCFTGIECQINTEEIVKKAMRDEMNRNLENLALEGLQRPFFISYTISDAKTLYISSTLGAIISSMVKPYRKHRVRVLVGSYKQSNENFIEMNSMFNSESNQGNIPLDNDYFGIRNSLWKTTDNCYKNAAEIYERKISAIKQQNISEEEAELNDFCENITTDFDIPTITFDFDKQKWENTAIGLSAIFKDYSEIFSSNVSVFLYQAEVYFLNSEGTETKYPVTLTAIRVNAQTQAEDGEPLFDHVLYYSLTPDDLPSLKTMKSEIKSMADNLVAIRNAPVFDDSYSGPVLFEDQAVAELFVQTLFSEKAGLNAIRKLIFSQPQMATMVGQMLGKSLESKIDKKIISKDLTIKATPNMKEFQGEKLIGSFEVDAEGVQPDDELILVEKGILKTLLNGRTPTPKVKVSNGHKRISLYNGGLSSEVGPSVISVSSSNVLSRKKLKDMLIEKALEEDLEYAIIIRKLESSNCGREQELDPSIFFSSFSGGGSKSSSTRPLYIYKVSLEDGKEELIRTTEIAGLSVKTLKKMLSASTRNFAYNTMLMKDIGGLSSFIFSFSSEDSWLLNGIPSSFIVPNAILIEELDIQKEKRAVTMKPPIVNNPVGN